MATNTYVALDKKTVTGSAVASVEFTGISQSYTDLIIIANEKLSTTADASVTLRFNGDTTSNYATTYVDGNGTTASGGVEINQTLMIVGYANQTINNNIIHIMNYSNATTTKAVIARSGSGSSTVRATTSLWRKSPEAITSIVVGLNTATLFDVGSTFSLYGIKAWIPESTSKATGGYVYSDATYWYHAFLSSGTFTPNQSLTCDILQVAGGGGGSIGGGGAGGLLEYSSQSLTATNYSVTVGAGGKALVNNVTSGSKGTASQFAALTASVGGGTGQINDGAGADLSGGGSGGGGGGSSASTTTGGAGTSGQGNAGGGNGGSGLSGTPAGGGGGKGAGGGNGSANTGGNGGIGGTSSLINAVAIATNTGQKNPSNGNYYFAGGGGGGGNGVTNFGQGGFGGGANASNVPVANALPNTGGGGGGYNGGLNQGSNGGSGIVVVRYAK